MSSGPRAQLSALIGRHGRHFWAPLAALALAAAAFAAWSDRPGLRADYVSLLDERPVLSTVDGTLAIDEARSDTIFVYNRIFSIRWRGWLAVDRAGRYGFRVTSSGPTRLAIDGRDVLTREIERRVKPARVELEPGFHRLEIDFDHSGDEIAFATEMRPPQGEWGPLREGDLFARRPGPVRRLTRALLDGLSGVGRNLTATVLALLALTLLSARQRATQPLRWTLPAWTADPTARRWLARGGLALLFAVATAAILPRAGSPFGWDDVRYLDMAAFDRDLPWVLHRYAHVYLLDAFIWMARGDAFLGARYFWAVQFGLIVCSFAVAARSLGPKLQVATFGASLLFLFSQPLYFLRAGASVPDTTVGTFVIIAVALYLHRRRGPGLARFEWQLLVIGAITVWAIRSKELGVILLWLVVLLPFETGRLDWRALRRKGTAWVAGAAAGLALLMVLDGLYFGDPLRGVRPANQRAVSNFNFEPSPQQDRSIEGWIDVIAAGRTPVARDDPRMPYMALLVLAAAFIATLTRRPLELRLLHLMPALFVLMLMALHVRATYVFLVRYLYPVVPLSCFLAAAAFYYLGLDELRWREVRSPRFFVPAALLAFLVFGVAAPYQVGLVAAQEFLPAGFLESIHWPALDAFASLVAAPMLVLTLALGFILLQHHRPSRVLLAGALVFLFLGQPLARTLWELRVRSAWQRGEMNLYPLRVFGDRIPEHPGAWIEVSSSLLWGGLGMFGSPPTCERITKVYLRRDDMTVACGPFVTADQDVAFLSREDWEYWRSAWPELEPTAEHSPGGDIVIVRPRAAAPPAPEQPDL